MKILVTGALGTIGRALVDELRQRGHAVMTSDLSHYHESGYMRCDIGQYRQVLDLFDSIGPIDLVYNCAAEFGRQNGEEYFEQLWHSNVIGLKNLLDMQIRHQFRLVHFSSSEIYGDYSGLMKDHHSEFFARPLNDYAMTKLVNEWQIANAAERHQTQTVRVRLFNIYGRERYTPYRSVIARFCYHALHGLPFTVHLGHKRSFLYIDDAIRTIANIADHFKPGEVYNIGSGRQYDIKDVADLVIRLSGTDPSLVQYSDQEPMTTKQKRVNTKKARRDLDHRVSVSLERGIAKTIAWMRTAYGV